MCLCDGILAVSCLHQLSSQVSSNERTVVSLLRTQQQQDQQHSERFVFVDGVEKEGNKEEDKTDAVINCQKHTMHNLCSSVKNMKNIRTRQTTTD